MTNIFESEVIRQSMPVDPYADHLRRAFELYKDADTFTGDDISTIAGMVNDGTAYVFPYRNVPVFFMGTVTGAAPAERVFDLMESLIAAQDVLSVDEFVKGFLDIHPFEDGNGRTAFVLYNLKVDNDIESVVPLPYYYGQS